MEVGLGSEAWCRYPEWKGSGKPDRRPKLFPPFP